MQLVLVYFFAFPRHKHKILNVKMFINMRACCVYERSRNYLSRDRSS